MRVQSAAEVVKILGTQQVGEAEVLNLVCIDADGLEFDVAYWGDIEPDAIAVGDRILFAGKVRLRKSTNSVYLMVDARQIAINVGSL